MPIEINLFRDRGKDYKTQIDTLVKKGWTEVTEPISKIEIYAGFLVAVEPEDGTLLQKPDSFKLTQKILRGSPASGLLGMFLSPYIFVPKKPFSYFLNRHEAGSLIAVWGYQ